MSASAAAFWGSLGAALAALTAALRVARWPLAFVVLFGASALVLGPVAVLLVSRARPERRSEQPAEPPRRAAALPVAALLSGLGLVAPVLVRVLSVLKSSTHHRPLGAVTFALVAAVVTLGACGATLWLFSWAQSSGSPLARSLRRLVVALAVAGPVLLLLRGASSAALRNGIFDLSLGLGASLVLCLIPWPAALARFAQGAGYGLWLAAVLLGVVAAVSGGIEPASAASFTLAAPLAWLLR